MRKFLLLLLLLLTIAGQAQAEPDRLQTDTTSNIAFIDHTMPTRAVDAVGLSAFVGEDGTLAMYDISDPFQPQLQGRSGKFTERTIDSVNVDGDYAYVTDGESMFIVDVSTPPSIFLVGTHSMAWTWATDVEVVGSFAFVANASGGANGGMQVVDVSNPAAPQLITVYGNEATYSIDVQGNYAYLAIGGLQTANAVVRLEIVNIANPWYPQRVGTHDPLARATDVEVVGDYAFVAERQLCPQGECIPGGGGLRIVNVAIPYNPYEVAYYNSANAGDVEVVGDYLYLSTLDGLLVLNVRTRSAPYVVAADERWGGNITPGRDSAFVAGGTICFAERGGSGIGLRPCPDGYHFENYGDVTFTDFTIEDMRRMFGDDAVCVNAPADNESCIPRAGAVRWNRAVNQALRGGHCLGMAATSARFFEGISQPPSFYQDGANAPFELLKRNARRHIAYYSAMQFAQPLSFQLQPPLFVTPNSVLDDVRSAIANDQVILLILTQGTMGHVLTPFQVTYTNLEGQWIIWAYDSNKPNQISSLYINANDNTWWYDSGWSGGALDRSLYSVPLSRLDEQQTCIACWLPFRAAAAVEGQIWLNGDGHLLIENSQGQRLGFAGTEFVNEVPGAQEQIMLGGVSAVEPVYTVPMTDTYTILVDGQTLTETAMVDVSQFGHGYGTSVSDIRLDPSVQDEIVISPDGMEVVYHSMGEQEVEIALGIDEATIARTMMLEEVDLGHGDSVTTTYQSSTGQLIFAKKDGVAGNYGFRFVRGTEEGQLLFWHQTIPIAGGATHYLNVDDWDGSGAITLEIDDESDGIIDQVIELENERIEIYLPNITMRE